MPLGTFTVTIDGNRLSAGKETAAQVQVRFASGREFVKDTDAGLFWFPHLSNPKPVSVSLPHSLTLVTDVTTGVSTTIGYEVIVTTAANGRVVAGPFPAEAAGVTIDLTDVTSDFAGTVPEDIAVRAETAATEAETAAASVQREQVNGVAGLDATGKLFETRIPDRLADATLAATYAQKPDNGNRAVGKGELTFNVLDYGAVSGGTGDDTAAFQAAVDAAATTPVSLGGEVFIPPGDYRITNVIVPDRVKIRGAGQRASRVEATATGVALQVGKENVLSDFYLTGTTIAGGTGIRFRPNSLHSTLRDMTITGHATGVVVDNSFVIQVRDTQIQACGNGLHITGTVGCNIVLVNGGEVQGCTNGVVIDGANNYGLKFLGTTVEGNSNKGFAVNGGTYSLTIRDCYMEANTAGHVFFGGAGHFGTIVSGNHFSRAGAFGVNVPAGLNVRDITVEGNSFEMTTAGAKSIYLGSGVIVANVGKNYYYTASIGNFDPAVDFLGNRLIYTDQGRLNLRPSFGSQSAGGAPFNIPHGTAPTNPVNGDIWTTTAGLFVHINGVTVGPLS